MAELRREPGARPHRRTCRRSTGDGALRRTSSSPTSPTSRSCTASASWPTRAPSPRWSGSSGSGKSTIISLLCAFHTPSSGRVLVDGIDLAHGRPRHLSARQLGVVLQETFLFDGTHPREHHVLAPRCHRGAVPVRLPHRARRRVRRALSRWLRHHRGRARREALRRPAPAPVDCARHPRRPAHPDPRRGHQLARFRVRSDDPGTA